MEVYLPHPHPPAPCRWETSGHSNPPGLRGADQHTQVQVAQTHFQPERVCGQVLSTHVSHVDGSCGFFDTSQDGRPSLQVTLPSTLPPAWSSTVPGPEQVTPFMTADQRTSWASPGTAGVGRVRLACGTGASRLPPDADPPEPPGVAGRSHPDILLSVLGLWRTHRVSELQSAQVGPGSGGSLPTEVPRCRACLTKHIFMRLPAWDRGQAKVNMR